MNRFSSLVLGLLSAMLFVSTASAFSHAGASDPVTQTTTFQTASFAASASATESGPSILARHLRHPLSVVNEADAASSMIASQGQNSGWLIGLVIVIGGVIFGLAHLRKS